jgi:choline kinase
MRAIILAAGRGSRLGPATAEKPKCMVELLGRPLLDWQIAALQRAGISDIVVVTGYRRDIIEALGVKTRHNPRWADTNMVASLLSARDAIDRPVLVSYSDIVYAPAIVTGLMGSGADLAITYDLDWLELWQRRFADPRADAESFVVDESFRLREIGRKIDDVGKVMGQYMGLLRLTPASLTWIDGVLAAESDPVRRDKLDMTSLLGRIVAAGHPVTGVPIRGGWSEVDSPSDLVVATELANAGKFQ